MDKKTELLGIQKINREERRRLEKLLNSVESTIADLEKGIARDERTVQLAKRHPNSVTPQALRLAKTSIGEDKTVLKSEKKVKKDLLSQLAQVGRIQKDVEKKLKKL